MATAEARYPYESPISAYGNGGFRFADMSHKGSILCLPTGIYAWDGVTAETVSLADFSLLVAMLSAPTTILFGTGATQIWPSSELTDAFAKMGLTLEPMSTGAAARTYNILLAEKRGVAAALIAVP